LPLRLAAVALKAASRDRFVSIVDYIAQELLTNCDFEIENDFCWIEKMMKQK